MCSSGLKAACLSRETLTSIVAKMRHTVYSIDPGTRNIAIAVLDYVAADDALPPATMEEFLGRVSLRHLGLADLGT